MSNLGNILQWFKIEWYRRIFAALQQDWRQEHATAKIKVLEQNLQEAMRFLKQVHIKKLFYRNKLPWILVIGAENVGKTQLLANSGLRLVSTDNKALQQVNPTAYCDWWFAREAVFVDGSGALLMPENPNNDSHIIWSKFIALLNSYRRQRPADGIVLCIDLYDFINKNRMQRQLQIDIFRHRLQCLTQFINQLPVYIVFTKCDQIPGFTDSFNSLSPEDSQQAFGIQLPLGLAQQNLSQQLEEQFTLFLHQLNGQLIDRLHREHNLEKRGRIKDFPLQLESQKTDIIQLANQVHSNKAFLCGIFFTSSMQDGKISDALAPLLEAYGLPNISHQDYAPQKRTFFVHHLLKNIFNTKLPNQRKMPYLLTLDSKKFYGIAGAIFLLFSAILWPNYYHTQTGLAEVSDLLKKYQHSSVNPSNLAFLAQLSALQTALNETRHRNNFFSTLLFHHSKSLENNLTLAYQQTLTSQFVPYLKQTLNAKLQNAANARPQELFNALKTYLMLGDPTHLNTDFVENWFSKSWHQNLTGQSTTIAQLQTHLHAWLQQKSIEFIPDPNLVQLARQNLSSLPLSQLIYLSLLDGFEPKKIEVNTPPFTMPPIINLYSAEYFKRIYDIEIPQLARQLATGDNWVLYLKLPANLAGPLTEQLIQSVRHLYVQNYVNFWQNQLTNIKLEKFQSLAQLYNFTAELSHTDSATLPLMNLINKNIQPVAKLYEAQPLLTLESQLRNSLQQAGPIHKALENLSNYLAKMIKDPDPGLAALHAAQQRMTSNGNDVIGEVFTVGKSAPLPLNNWLNSIAANTWTNILQAAQNHLNLIWITKVLPEYHEKIKNRYPLASNASSDISLSSFTNFFAPNGTMDNFHKHYLAAFIDTSQLYWQWKSVDGEKLNIPQSTLEMLDRAALIQKMFFAENPKQPMVKFTVTPTALGPLPKNILLNLQGQTIDYLHDLRQIKRISWGIANNTSASLTVVNGGHQQTIWRESGEWATYKLLTHANWLKNDNSQQYQLNFIADGIAAPYELIATKAINPFIPEMLTAFNCPEKL